MEAFETGGPLQRTRRFGRRDGFEPLVVLRAIVLITVVRICQMVINLESILQTGLQLSYFLVISAFVLVQVLLVGRTRRHWLTRLRPTAIWVKSKHLA